MSERKWDVASVWLSWWRELEGGEKDRESRMPSFHPAADACTCSAEA